MIKVSEGLGKTGPFIHTKYGTIRSKPMKSLRRLTKSTIDSILRRLCDSEKF